MSNSRDNPSVAPDKPSGPVATPRHKRWWFWPLILVVLLLLLPLVLVAVVLLALLTDKGTAWTIEQIPGLQTEAGRGSMLGQWQAERLEWRGYGVEVLLASPEINWSPSCLFEKTLCLETLKATSITVNTQPSETEDDAPRGDINLPEISLPVALVVRDIQLGEFTLNGTTVWDRVELKSEASGSALTVEHASYQLGEIQVTARGRAEMRRDWPVDLDVTTQLPPPVGDAWSIYANLSGSVRDVRLSGRSEGYLNARLNGTVQPLDAQLPAALRLEAAGFKPYDSLPDTLTLKDWVLTLEGSLAEGFRTRSWTQLPGSTGAMAASVKGLVTTGGVSDLLLAFSGPLPEQSESASEPEYGTLEVRGDASWAGGLRASADLVLDRFPWYALLPGMEPPPVQVRRLDGQVAYQDDRYNADLQAAVTGPQGDADLTVALEGDLQGLSIRQLNATTGAGSLAGTGELDFADQLAWQARLVLDRFNPGYWVPVLEASLNGEVNSEGRLVPDSLPVMSADWDLKGRWQEESATARGQLASDGKDWQLDDLLVAVADNRIEGNGRYGEELAADLTINLPQPERLMPGLAGELAGRVSLGGSVEDPDGDLTLTARAFEWQDLVRIETVDLKASLASGGILDAGLDAADLRVAGQELSGVNMQLEGNRGDHRLTLNVEHPETSVALTLAGALGDTWTTWQGALVRGQINVPGPDQVWRLSEPANLSYNQAGELSFGAHCWRWQQSSVCAQDQQLLPDTRIAYQVRNFPMQALSPLLPQTFRWQAALDADIDIALTDQGPDGEIRLDAGSGAFEFLILDDWERLEHNTLTLNARLKPDVAELVVALEGPELGTFGVDLSVNPNDDNRPVEGEFSLKDLNLAFVSAFAGIEEVAGEVNGQGRLSGPLLRPQVEGELALTNGRVFDPDLPLPMEDIVLVLEFLGNRADISGRWQSNDRSSGELSGLLDWRDEPEVQLNISGERLPVTVEPYARVEIGPDLDIAFRGGELSVSGRVDVPRGDIEIKGLPPSAVSVSEDEVIVGVEREEPTIRTMLMDVTVVVGEDEVSFNAFDVTGNLEGTLRIGNNMDTRGALQLVDGRYEAFGQDLDLRRARIIFVGALAEPYLDIEAVRTVDTVVAGIRLSGPVSAPETEVFSEPSMPQSDALSYIILGRPPQSQGDEGQMSQAAISLGLTQASKVTQGIGDELGIRNLTLEAEGSGDEAAVVASGYLTDELSLRYGVGIFEPITTVALRYDLGRYFYLEAASGLAASLDIFYTRNF